MTASRPYESCSCGRSYTFEEWRKLDCPGLATFPDETLELRNCVCQSTMARQIEPLTPEAFEAMREREQDAA